MPPFTGTRLHLPDDPLPTPATGGGAPAVEVTGETELVAARRLAEGGEVAALVFASAKTRAAASEPGRRPGGERRAGLRAVPA